MPSLASPEWITAVRITIGLVAVLLIVVIVMLARIAATLRSMHPPTTPDRPAADPGPPAATSRGGQD